MSREIETFLDQLVLSRGLSKNTREAYRADLEALENYLSNNGAKSVVSATRKDILDFLESQQKNHFADSTLERRLVAIKVFYAWMADEGPLRDDPAAPLTSPRQIKHLPDTLTEEQMRKIVTAFDGTTPIALRNRAMLELLYASGLRATELVTLKLEELHLNESFLRCTGKGNKQRVVPVGGKAAEAIKAYLEDGRPALAMRYDDGTLFISNRGTGLTRATLWNIVNEAAIKSGLKGKVHPHTLRHCFATHLLSHGANIRAIQEMLGHANIATTQIYTHVDSEKLLETHRRFHPRNQ